MKQRQTNEDRAARAALRLLTPSEPRDWQIVDMLTNLRHLCDREDLDFADLDRRASNHYVDESAYNKT